MAKTPNGYLNEHRERILDELIEFVSIPSVSADSAYQADMQRAAQWVSENLRDAGLQSVRSMPTTGSPVIYAEWLGAPQAPTILVYGHYDVQPPDPLDKWRSAPFQPQIRDGRLYGRGVSDDKGPLLIPIKAAQAFLSTAGSLPVNLKFLIEGEEEIGSPSLTSFIAEHAALLAADFVLSADGAMWRADVPSVTVASRGLAGVEFTLSGAGKDLHSGRHGGAAPNALHAMAELVASLHAADGSVAVDGFYQSVVELDAAERAEIQSLPFDDEDYLTQIDAQALIGEPGYSAAERLWTRPTLEINGLWGGYQGEGSKTVIPREAHAKITCRLVPHQEPDDVIDKIVRHLRTHLPPGVCLSIQPDHHGAAAYRIPEDHPGLLVAETVLAEIYGEVPLRVRMGGTLPVSELFQRLLGIHTVFFSFSTADEDFHAPNEFFRIARLYDGLQAWTLYWQKMGKISQGES